MNYFRKSRLIGFKSLIYVFVCAHQQEVRERSNQDGKLFKMSICVDATQICERAPLPIFHSNHGLIQFLSNGTISTMVVKASATFLEAGLFLLPCFLIVQSLHSTRCASITTIKCCNVRRQQNQN